jgi:hypothetical protein
MLRRHPPAAGIVVAALLALGASLGPTPGGTRPALDPRSTRAPAPRASAASASGWAHSDANLPPQVTITCPRPSAGVSTATPSRVTISWQGSDPDGIFTTRPVGYAYRLIPGSDQLFNVVISNPDSLRKLAIATNWSGWTRVSPDTTQASFADLAY